jgi:hypothetical protein
VARRSPTAATTVRKITNGHSPIRISVSPKVASSAATTIWQFAAKAGAAGQRGSVHRGDQRLGHADSRREDALVNFVDVAGAGRQHLVQIHARAERFAIAAEQHRAHARIVFGFFQRRAQRAAQVHVQRIAPLRPVQRELQDAAFAANL